MINMTEDNTPIKQRIQITFGKFDSLRYTGNLDVAKLWERVLRRANVPILYSQGFNPRPRIQLATALPLGITSECEILDVSLREPIALDDLVERLAATSPAGLVIYTIQDVPVRSPALQALVRSAEYRIHFEDGVDRGALEAGITALLAADEVMLTKEKKGSETAVNIRPLIHGLAMNPESDLLAHLATGDQGNLRPDDLLALLGLQDEFVSIHRSALHVAVPG
jgi:radical SAM-linked protein